MAYIRIFVADYRKWPKSYWVIGCYTLACAFLVAFAPAHFQPHIPASAAFAAISSFPATTAFSIEGMWLLLPLALAAFSFATPVKIRRGFGSANIVPTAILFVLLGLVVTPLFAYPGLFLHQIHTSTATRIDRIILGASQSKVVLVGLLSFYFLAVLGITWVSFIAIPRSIVMLSKMDKV